MFALNKLFVMLLALKKHNWNKITLIYNLIGQIFFNKSIRLIVIKIKTLFKFFNIFFLVCHTVPAKLLELLQRYMHESDKLFKEQLNAIIWYS